MDRLEKAGPALATATVLLLVLSGVTVAFATRAPVAGPDDLGALLTSSSGQATSTSTTSSPPPSQSLGFKLVPVSLSSPPPNYRPGYGAVSVGVSMDSVLVYVYIVNATRTAPMMIVMNLQGNGLSGNKTLGTITTDASGNAQFKTQFGLPAGTYRIGFSIVDASTFATTTVLMTSSPTSAEIVSTQVRTTTSATSTPTSYSSISCVNSSAVPVATSTEHSVTYKLVSLPAWLLLPQPTDYPFKYGGALAVIDGNTLRVFAYVIGRPQTQFAVLLTANKGNVTMGSLTTNADGCGFISTTTTLASGTYQLGFLIDSLTSTQAGGLVGVSDPRTRAAVVGPQATTTTTTTTKSSTGSSLPYVYFTFVTAPGFSPPANYEPGLGGGGALLQSGVITTSVAVEDAAPGIHYLLLLSVNGSVHSIGDFVTDNTGSGRLTTTTKVGTGSFTVGFRLNDTSSFSSPKTVFVSNPLTQKLAPRSTTPTSAGATSFNELSFKMLPIVISGAPASYRIGYGDAYIGLQGETVGAKVELQMMDPSTHYEISMVVNGSALSIGNLTTSNEGVGQLAAILKLKPGHYLLGLSVADLSTFKSEVKVMQSDPRALPATVVGPAGESTETTSSQGNNTKVITVTSSGQGDDVEAAIQGKRIPAIIHVTDKGAVTSILDSDFSVSVGKLEEKGLLVSISASNVTGSRVLLINLTRNVAPSFTSGALVVKFDGTQIEEASSLLQVLNSQPGDPARFIVIVTSTGTQLLVSIPHFSLHTIEVLPVALNAVGALIAIDAPILAVTVLLITSVFGIIYARRFKVFL